MRRVLLLLFLILQASCAPVQAPMQLPTSTETLVFFQPTFAVISPTVTATPFVPTSTVTPEICDPQTAEYCVVEGHFLFQRPIKPPDNTFVDVTYRYASTANGTRDPHHGVEFYNKFGTPVHAAQAGVVIFAGPDAKAIYSPWQNYYGNVIVIRHMDDLYTLYAHLSKISVEAGEMVIAGEQIGEVGQTGVAIGSHLHFEVRRGNVENYFSTQNPELWLIPNQDVSGKSLGAIQISALSQDGTLAKHAEFTLEYLDAHDQPTGTIYYGATYSSDLLQGEENAAMGDLPAGKYRIVLQYNGWRFERWVEVESGRLTQAVFTANQ